MFLFFISKENKNLIKSIKTLSGINPGNIELYKLATQHRSIAKHNEIGLQAECHMRAIRPDEPLKDRF